MNAFLSTILETKRTEVHKLQQIRHDLEAGLGQLPLCRGFADAIARQPGLSVVAEVKQASPSKGLITNNFRPVETALTYEQAGACAVSVLTDEQYFKGSLDVLRRVRGAISRPVLRKDFIIDELQVMEARQAGADAVLLICAALDPNRVLELADFAKSLSLDVLVEVHSVAELDVALQAGPSVFGINNRNLHTFEVSLETTERILREAPSGILAIAESGVNTPQDAARMSEAGVKGILVGEALMRAGSPDNISMLIRSFQEAGTFRFGVEMGHDLETPVKNS